MLIGEIWSMTRGMMPTSSLRGLVGLWVLLAMISIFEVVSIVGWYPFISALTDRTTIHTSPHLSRIYHLLHFQSDSAFLVFLGAATILMLVTGSALRILGEYLTCRFAWAEQVRLADGLLERILLRPYEWFLSRNSSDLVNQVVTEVPALVNGCLITLSRMFAGLVLTSTVCIGLVILDPWVALVSTTVIGAAYVLIYRVVRSRISVLGEQRVLESASVLRSVWTAISAAKESRFSAWELDFRQAASMHQRRLNAIVLSHRMLGSIPGQVTEVTAKVGVLVVALYFVLTGVSDYLPLMAIYIVAVIRVAPEAHVFYRDLTSLRYHKPGMQKIYEQLREHVSDSRPAIGRRLPLVHAIRLEGVTYQYPQAQGPAVRNIDLEVPCRSSVALVGETGAGKTTVADLLAGVLVPRSGKVVVDGQELDPERRSAWRANIGYVPQNIYLINESVRRNIAFGVPAEQIDDRRVEDAARAANIHDFIADELPSGYETGLGERGISLSGGQRQRIGIARALYHDPDVLIFDEATSALDNLTEQAILEALESLSRQKTLIVIAHRLTTVVGCDLVCFLQRGRIEASGTYQQLLETSPAFRTMALTDRRDQALPS